MTLRTENLTVSYGTDKVLNDVSLSLPTGKITALIGPNGCGKSTLLNCFSRLLMPQSGTVFLGDNPINMLSSRQLARRLSLLPQHHLTPEGITVQELVSYGRNPWLSLWGRLSAEDNARVNVAMNQTRINHLAVRRLTSFPAVSASAHFWRWSWPRIRPLYYLMSQPPILISITRWT